METYKLSDLCEILDSQRKPLSALQRAKKQGIYPYYGAQGIIDHLDEYLLDGEYLLVAEDGANLETRNQPIANIANGKIWVNNHAHVLGNNGKCPLNLLGFILNNMNISPYVTGCAQPKLNQENLRNIEIELPSHIDRIASILSSLDRKIELNNKINADLEEMAQAIFKNWFVDFEPFKDGKLVDSELGMIPEGWKVGGLFDIAEIFDKKRKPLSGNVREKMDKIYPYYGATSCMDYVDDYIFDGIYTLIGEDGSVVKENGLPYMQYVWGKMWVNNHAHILQGKNGYSTEMIHALLSITNIKFLVTGAVQAKLSQGNMQKILVAIPPKNVLDEIRPVIDNLYSKIRSLSDENSRLSLLRDTLLPRLMSGELEVPE